MSDTTNSLNLQASSELLQRGSDNEIESDQEYEKLPTKITPKTKLNFYEYYGWSLHIYDTTS